MISYKDKTFCSFYGECKHGFFCQNALTEEVKEKAGEMPIAHYAKEPQCFKKQ